jgi:6-phosphogluconolactonase (cycloisomerase 2 family)
MSSVVMAYHRFMQRKPKTMRIQSVKTRAAAIGAVVAAATAVFAVPASANAPTHHRPSAPAGVVFAQSDSVSGNTVTAYNRLGDGSLLRKSTYSTGGKGLKLDGAAVDDLGSQGSLTYDKTHRLLYAVNAGSDTLTVFSVDGNHLIRRQVISTDGSAPVSVTVQGGNVYVLNALDGGSVQGYRSVAGFLVRIPTWHRALGLDPDAAPQFNYTPGQISFTPDGRKLIVTTKSNTDSLVVFDVNRLGAVAAHPTTTTASGTDPFSFVFDDQGRVLATEGVPNAVATYGWGRNDKLVKTDDIATGQKATCWITRDGQYVYTGNAGSGTISQYREDNHGKLTSLGTVTTDPGTVDLTVSSDGAYLYAQTGGNGVVDAFRVGHDGTLTKTGSATIPNGAGGEGIVAL